MCKIWHWHLSCITLNVDLPSVNIIWQKTKTQINVWQLFKIILYSINIPQTPSNVGVLWRIIFSHTADEAISGGLAKACVPGKNCSVPEKFEFLIEYQTEWEVYMLLVKNLFHKAKEEGKDLYQCLMIYCYTPLSHTLQSLMQILTSRSARSSLPMSNTARQQKCLNCKDLRAQCNNKHLPTHDFHIGQSVMYLNPVNRRGYPATIASLCQEPQSYKIKTDDGTIYRKTQSHLKVYQRNTEKMNINDTQTKRSYNTQKSRTKHKVKPLVKLDL